ncbi:MAG TPA: hypothetical protein VJN89_03480 [Candidatus Acidoferrum sp.]|nr:hypothetical protein [Candidatus Acidoferrum sp.]
MAALYAAMSNEELQEVADDADSLTDVARATLRAEMIRRGMEAPPEARIQGEEGERQFSEPAIIARYRDLPVALVANSLLDSAGLEGFLADDVVIRLDWLWSNALGGIKVWVRGNEAMEARELLEAGIPERFEAEGVGEYQQPKCPNCNSLDVAFEELDRRIAHIGLLVGIPIPATKRGWNCHACKHAWDAPADSPAE